MASMDGVPVDNFPVHLPWVRIEKLPGEQVSVLLMAIQVTIKLQGFVVGKCNQNGLSCRWKYLITCTVEASKFDFRLNST